MSLSFLRPARLPRPSTIRQFLKISNVRNYSTPTSSGTPAPTIQSTPPTKAAPAKPSKPYRVLLSPSNQYPVYQDTKRGGNKQETKIKNIQGDIQAMRRDLQELLSEPGKAQVDVTIKDISGQLVVRVRH
jgi:large subunit ribosomal protein L49